MKFDRKVIFLSAALGLVNWVFDAITDHAYFYKAPFLDLLIFDIPSHELLMRAGEFAVILCFGIIMSRIVAARTRAEKGLIRAKGELEAKVVERTAELSDLNVRLKAELDRRTVAEERFRVALAGSPVIVFSQDADLRYTWIYNPGPGFPHAEVIGKTDTDVLPPDDAAALTRLKRGVLESGTGTRQEVKVTVSGETRFYDLTIEPLQDLSGNALGITCAASDVTRYRYDAEVLQESEARLRSLSFDLMTAQESERGRIARELQDELLQALTLIKLRLRPVIDALPQDQPAPREECNQTLAYLDHVISGVRHLSEELRPSMLDVLGLTAALRRLADEWRRTSDFNVTASIMNIDGLLPRSSQIVFYRIVQECLSNISKHVQAGNVGIVLSNFGDRFSLFVEHEGRGFNVAQAQMRDQQDSWMAVIEERVRMLEGILSLSVQPGKGMQLAISIPALFLGDSLTG